MKGRCIDNTKGCLRLLEIGKLYDLAPAKYTRAIDTKFSVEVPNRIRGMIRFDLYKWRFKVLPGVLNKNINIL
jgi:hypothetical protein